MKTKIVRWDITGMCNLNCLHCYNQMPSKEELSTTSIFHILRKLLAYGLRELNLSGREPIMRDDLHEIARWCHLHHVRVNLTTNGTLLSQVKLARLARFVDMIVCSLDGPNCAIHDAIRGRGSFKKTITNMENCRKFIKDSQIDLQLGVSCTMNRINHQEIADMVDLCSSLDVAFLSVNPISFYGSASSLKERLYLSPHEIIDAWEDLCCRYCLINPTFYLQLGALPMEARMLNVRYNLELPVIQNSCTAGNSLYIDPYGEAFPCYMIPPISQAIPEFSYYSKSWRILTQPISDAVKAFSAFIDLTRKHIQEENSNCAGCEYSADCKPCPLILLTDTTVNERCKIAQKRLAGILSKIDDSTIPSIKCHIKWSISGDRLTTYFHRGDYSSEKEFIINPRAHAIWRSIDGLSTCADIRTKISEKYRWVSSSNVDRDVKEFVNYLRKEGILELKCNE